MEAASRARRCSHPDGCSKVPSYGFPSEGKQSATRCASHREPGMEDVVNKRCQHPDGCAKRLLFGHPGEAPTRCASHQDPGMQSVRKRKGAEGDA